MNRVQRFGWRLCMSAIICVSTIFVATNVRGVDVVHQEQFVVTKENFNRENFIRYPEHKDAFIGFAFEKSSAEKISYFAWHTLSLIELYPESVLLKDLMLIHCEDFLHHILYYKHNFVNNFLPRLFASHPGLDEVVVRKVLEFTSIDVFGRAFDDELLHFKLIERIKSNINSIEFEKLACAYDRMSASDQKIIRELKGNKEKPADIVDHALTKADIFVARSLFFPKCTSDNCGTTQTGKHFCQNLAGVLAQINMHKQKLTVAARETLSACYTKEKEEQAKGNYVFYHGQRWEWRFKSDMYKQFFNLRADKLVGDDYQFLRFGADRSYNNFYICDAIFLNGALFGNSTASGSCTFEYFMNNPDWTGNRVAKFSTQWIAEQFNLGALYGKYAAEFAVLEKMHDDLQTGKGNLLLFSIPKDKINEWVYPCWGNASRRTNISAGGRNLITTREVLDTLCSAPQTMSESDTIEYAMPTIDAVLDPYTGPRIYSFNAANKEKMQHYVIARDKLFEKMRQDIKSFSPVIV